MVGLHLGSIQDIGLGPHTKLTCKTLRDSEIWRTQERLKLFYGPMNTWDEYCHSMLEEAFDNEVEQFPCRYTCGFCKGNLSHL